MNDLVVHSVSDIERMARAISLSKLFGVQNPEQAIALCLIAQAEGRHPASAAQDYHIISGRPSKKADAMLRDFLGAGGKVEWHALDDNQADATFSHPAGGRVRIMWDMTRAQQAQLKTQMWTKYPRQMLRSRTVSEGVRTVYPMATSGMYVPEEVQEFGETESKILQTKQESAHIENKSTEKSKTDSREIYSWISQANRELDTVEKFDAFWSRPKIVTALEEMPIDWRRNLEAERDDKAIELRESASKLSDDRFPGDAP